MICFINLDTIATCDGRTDKRTYCNGFLPRLCRASRGYTMNSSADKICERYRLNHAITVKLLLLLYSVSRNVRLSKRRIATFSAQWGRIVTFLTIAPLLVSFLFIDIYASSMEYLQTTCWEDFLLSEKAKNTIKILK